MLINPGAIVGLQGPKLLVTRPAAQHRMPTRQHAASDVSEGLSKEVGKMTVSGNGASELVVEEGESGC